MGGSYDEKECGIIEGKAFQNLELLKDRKAL